MAASTEARPCCAKGTPSPRRQSTVLVFWSFVLFELCCGIHFPLISTLRSRYIPEDSRSAVLNLVRIPLNLLVCIILLKVRGGAPRPVAVDLLVPILAGGGGAASHSASAHSHRSPR